MKRVVAILLLAGGCTLSTLCIAQNQEQKEKSPEEIATELTERMGKDLSLNQTQLFYVDSILRNNYTAMFDEIQKMKEMGMQDSRNYKTVYDRWNDKNLEAFKKILQEQQYISYLKLIGKGKEYKKGKDGKYYKKESKK
jgi:hypothetical protein